MSVTFFAKRLQNGKVASMTALTFTHDTRKDHHIGYQPDGTYVGYVRRSRLKDPRYTFEARIRRPLTGVTDSAGYGSDIDTAKWLLVASLSHRTAHFVQLSGEY